MQIIFQRKGTAQKVMSAAQSKQNRKPLLPSNLYFRSLSKEQRINIFFSVLEDGVNLNTSYTHIKQQCSEVSLFPCVSLQLSSYGGFLSYQVKSFGLPSEGMVLLDKRPDIQLTVSAEIFFSFKQYYGFFLLPDNYDQFCFYRVINFYSNLLQFYKSDFAAFCSKPSTHLSLLSE